MLIVLIGFVLFAVLILGVALLTLSLLFLVVAQGFQAFASLVGLTGGNVPDLATSIQLASGSSFVLGWIVVAIGATSLFFAPVRALLRGLWIVARMAAEGFPLLSLLVNPLRAFALALETGAGVLEGPASTAVGEVGTFLVTAGQALPDTPTIDFVSEPLWLEHDQDGNRTGGYLPNPLGLPDVDIVTSITVGAAAPTLVENALVDSGNNLATASGHVGQAGDSFSQAADRMTEIADFLEGLS